jgi:hypothetical protein
MVLSGDQNARRIHKLKTENNSFPSVEYFKYLVKILDESKFYSGIN